ncbi:hypothetical protein X946_5509 [Burkholderia sp. ABCPW 111]|nr:hypothetical protein X946_5509 [Burkholderia sp. ABCPW 111]
MSLPYGNCTEMLRLSSFPRRPTFHCPPASKAAFLQLVSKSVAVQRDSRERRVHDTKLTLRSSPGTSSTATRQGGANPA